MIELNGNFESILKELRTVLSSIKGVKSISETVDLSYVVEVSTLEEKENVEKVSGLLSSQAEKYGFYLSVTPATSEEIEKSKNLLAQHLASQTQFKA